MSRCIILKASDRGNILNIEEILDELNCGSASFSDQLDILVEKIRDDEEKALAILDELLENEKNPKNLLSIVKKFAGFKSGVPTENLVDILLHKDNAECPNQESYLRLRCMVATLLGNIKDHSTVVPLLYVLNNKDEHYKLRLNVAESLGRMGNRYAVAPLIDIVSDEGEKSIYVRESAAKALGMLGDIRAISPFVSILESKNSIVDKFTFLKEKIIEAITRLGSNNTEVGSERRTLKVLITSLSDHSPSIRLGAIEALSELDDEDEIVDLIKERIYDDEEEVARGAICALYNMRGREFIEDLYDEPRLAGWCKDEIEMIIEEEQDSDDE